MSNHYFPGISGFESFPLGRLLESRVEMEGSVGIAYERSLGYSRPTHRHERHALVFPRGASLVELGVEEKSRKSRFIVDNEHFLSLPADAAHCHQGKSTVYDTLAIFPTLETLIQIADEVKLSEDEREKFLGGCMVERRSHWLDELVERYFVKRVLSSILITESVEVLEQEILTEVARIFFQKRSSQAWDRADMTPAVLRALQYIEAELFSPLSSREIATRAKTSVASLFRDFKKELGVTPFGYIRDRRLDEARMLLKTGKHQVSDVALLVGYDDLSAFSKAFKARFGKPPSYFLGNR